MLFFLSYIRMKKVAIVDDEKDIVEIASFYVQKEGFEVYKFYSGNTFLDELSKVNFDCVVLDIMLPGVDGISILKFMRANDSFKKIPVILLTAKGSEGDIVLGLESGAKDYIVKPFSPRVLAAKVKIFTKEPLREALVKIGDLTVDFIKYEVYCKSERVSLTLTEFRILKTLFEDEEKVFTRDELLNEVWKHTVSPADRAIDVHVRHLREKLGKCGNFIKTKRGVGYKFSRET